MYLVNEISNRDLSLLYYYRILRQPSDYLSAIYDQGEPVITEIYEGTATDIQGEDGSVLYAFDLGIEPVEGHIPYLEFDTKNESDRKQLESLLYLDNVLLYGKSSQFEEPIQVSVYWVSSLDSIRIATEQYLRSLDELDITKLRDKFNNKKNQPKGIQAIEGRDENLVEFVSSESGLAIEDSDYMITSALDAQMLVNPSQELLMSLPRKLRHNINISVTDGSTRYLSSFTGYTINIRGDGNWIMRDVQSGINFVAGSGKINLWNCRLVHFRHTLEKDRSSDRYRCKDLYAHRSLVILNQGVIDDVRLLGGSTLIEVPASYFAEVSSSDLKHVTLIGHGCSLYSWVASIPVKPTNILGLAWWCNLNDDGNVLYIAGRRIDEVSDEHDEELKPSQIIEMNIDNIHIRQGE